MKVRLVCIKLGGELKVKRNWNNVLKYFICFVLGLSCFGQMNVYAQEEDSNVDEIGESSYASDVETKDEYDLDEDLNQPVEELMGLSMDMMKMQKMKE